MADLPRDDRADPMTRRPGSRWLFAAAMILAGLFLGAAVATLAVTLAQREPALHVLAQSDAGQVAQNDGRILIYTRIDRTRSCPVETTHWLFTQVNHGGDLVRTYVPIAEDGPVPIRELGLSSYVLSVPLPPGLWPAEWYWLESRAETCGPLGWLFPIYSQSEPLLVNIERARAIANVPVTAEREGKTTIRSRSPIVPPPTGVAR
jgi:hypothetical protein